jgi:hypothetical protein
MGGRKWKGKNGKAQGTNGWVTHRGRRNTRAAEDRQLWNYDKVPISAVFSSYLWTLSWLLQFYDPDFVFFSDT